tara:strand:+ start:8985 stop:9230 length:246 start_codon:yes stop_codon:yes gene_type:complete
MPRKKKESGINEHVGRTVFVISSIGHVVGLYSYSQTKPQTKHLVIATPNQNAVVGGGVWVMGERNTPIKLFEYEFAFVKNY